MPKRYKMKVEVEFECPATVPPEEAFYRYFSADNKVENDKVTLKESTLFTTPSKENAVARAHNEARRVLQVIIDSTGLPFKIIKGNRYRWNEGVSQFQVYLPSQPSFPSKCIDHHWVRIKGNEFQGANTKSINLAVPTSIEAAAQELKCTFWVCNHKNGIHA
jgi:hypothetical protein